MKLFLHLLAILALSILSAEEADKMVTWNKTILKPYCKELCKVKGWQLGSEGGGYRINADGQKIQKILLGFTCSTPLTLSEARRAFVEEIENIISLINQKSKHPLPCCFLDLKIRLGFADKNYKYLSSEVSFIHLMDGEIYYKKYNETTKSFEELLVEPYEEALRIVQEEQAHKAAEGTVKKKRKYAKNG